VASDLVRRRIHPVRRNGGSDSERPVVVSHLTQNVFRGNVLRKPGRVRYWSISAVMRKIDSPIAAGDPSHKFVGNSMTACWD